MSRYLYKEEIHYRQRIWTWDRTREAVTIHTKRKPTKFNPKWGDVTITIPFRDWQATVGCVQLSPVRASSGECWVEWRMEGAGWLRIFRWMQRPVDFCRTQEQRETQVMRVLGQVDDQGYDFWMDGPSWRDAVGFMAICPPREGVLNRIEMLMEPDVDEAALVVPDANQKAQDRKESLTTAMFNSLEQ